MKFYLALTILLATPASFAICKWNAKYPSEFSDNGRSITAYFAKHSTQSIGSEIQDLLTIKDAPRTAQKILAKHKDLLNELVGQSNGILKKAAAKQITWVGAEISPGEVKSYGGIKGFVGECKESFLTLQSVAKTNDEQTWKLLTLFYHSAMLPFCRSPETMKNIRLVALDDDIKTKQAEDFEALDFRSMSVFVTHRESKTAPLSLPEELSELSRLKLFKGIEITSQDLVDLMAGSEDRDLVYELEQYKNTFNKMIAKMRQRDSTMAAAAMNSPGNGVIVLGSAHGIGVKSRLQKLCLDSATQNPNTKTIEKPKNKSVN